MANLQSIFSLIPESGGAQIPLPSGSRTVLGRGELLQISDKRCSRQQATIIVAADNSHVDIIPGGVNPCFVYWRGQPPQPLDNGRRYTLLPADRFSLLAADTYAFTLASSQHTDADPGTLNATGQQPGRLDAPTATNRSGDDPAALHKKQRLLPPPDRAALAAPPCPYGLKCYRTGAEHLREFSHPARPPAAARHQQQQQEHAEAQRTRPDEMRPAAPATAAAPGLAPLTLRLADEDDDGDDTGRAEPTAASNSHNAVPTFAAVAAVAGTVPAASGRKSVAFELRPSSSSSASSASSASASSSASGQRSGAGRSLAFPSLSTGPSVWSIEPERAAAVACQAIRAFLEQHGDDRELRLLLVHPHDDAVVRAFRKHYRSDDARFRIEVAQLTQLRSAGLECAFVANETNWRMTSKSRRDVYAAAGPGLELATRAAHPKPAAVGGCYLVELPGSSPLRQSQGVHYILHCLGPNFKSYGLAPGQPVPAHIDPEAALATAYDNMLKVFFKRLASNP
eukprot:TRINITY_DN9905_c1_g1_i2.p1 TRINITY_DN9905_c1_g1~~TRINITY_DN9905_c1_g1_i2.p1  ORF type:complete len:511 (-),score=182.40 TRINITY_DN9905_c1_g1_i2:300-1832(-)